MTCEHVPMPGGGTMILCNRSRRPAKCRFCDHRASYQCDFPLKGRSAGKTCSVNLCQACAVRQPVTALHGDTVDFCPPHARTQQKEQLSLELEVPR